MAWAVIILFVYVWYLLYKIRSATIKRDGIKW